MSRLFAVLLAATSIGAEGVAPRWALDPGEHRIRSRVLQRIDATPPGVAPLTVVVETEERWKAAVEAKDGALRLALSWEGLRVREGETGEWREIDPKRPGANWAEDRLRALRSMAFDLVLSPDGRVVSSEARRLEVAPPPGLPQEVHGAMWDAEGLLAPLRAMWVRLPSAFPAEGQMLSTEDSDAGPRRIRQWRRTPTKREELETDAMRAARAMAARTWTRTPGKEVVFVGVWPDGAPAVEVDTIAAISPDVVSVTWTDAGEEGVLEADLDTGAVSGVVLRFHAALGIQVRRGDLVEAWEGSLVTEQTLLLDPPDR